MGEKALDRLVEITLNEVDERRAGSGVECVFLTGDICLVPFIAMYDLTKPARVFKFVGSMSEMTRNLSESIDTAMISRKPAVPAAIQHLVKMRPMPPSHSNVWAAVCCSVQYT